MHKSNYQPKRSQQLFLAECLKEHYDWQDQQVVVHHVLEDTSTKLYMQIERRWMTPMGFTKVVFERVQL